MTAQELDWLKRSTASGVTFATDFRSASDFTLASVDGGHVFANGMVPGDLARVVQDKTDGMPHTNGCCLRINSPKAAGPNGAAWMFPLNRAWTDKTQGFGGQTFWIQFRFKVPASRLVASNVGANELDWKFLNVAHYSPKNTASESASNRPDEIVLHDGGQRGIPQAYHQDGNSYPPFMTGFGSSQYRLQTGLDRGAGLPDDQRYCLSPGPGSAGCWRFPVDEWMTFQIEIQAASYGGAAGNRFVMKAARASDTQWTLLFDDKDFGLGLPGEFLGGLNGGHFLNYETNRINSSVDTHQKWTQVIVSTQEPAIPMATPVNDTYIAGSGGTVSAGAGAGAGSSVLADLAASMAPGTWAKLIVANQNTILGSHSPLPDSDFPGGTGGATPFGNNCCWNASNQCIEFVGQDHGEALSMRYMRYDLASNLFVLVHAGHDTHGNGTDSGTGPGHEFCGTTLNPTTGETYYTHYGTVGVSTFTVTKAALNGTSFATTLPASPSAVQNITAGSCWWSGSFTGGGGLGVQGGLMIFNAGNSSNSANDGQVLGYNPVTDTWPVNIFPASPFYYDAAGAPGGNPAVGAYQEVAAYSAVKNCMVYGGGGAAVSHLWRMSSNGTVTAMPNVPAGKEVGIQHGNICADPVTGNFLLLSAGQLWELNPTGSGTWTQQTGSRVPPGTMGIPGSPNFDGVLSTPMPAHGVIAYPWQKTSASGGFWLYKHA